MRPLLERLHERHSYQVEAVSSQYSDADWSRQRGEGCPTGRHTDPHLHHTEQEAQCTLSDLDRDTRIITMRSDGLERLCFEICTCQEYAVGLLSKLQQRRQFLKYICLIYSDVLTLCAF